MFQLPPRPKFTELPRNLWVTRNMLVGLRAPNLWIDEKPFGKSIFGRVLSDRPVNGRTRFENCWILSKSYVNMSGEIPFRKYNMVHVEQNLVTISGLNSLSVRYIFMENYDDFWTLVWYWWPKISNTLYNTEKFSKTKYGLTKLRLKHSLKI